MSSPHHVLINGLSMGSGGGFTVGKELLRHLAIARPEWKFTFAIISGNKLHEEISNESLPSNCHVFRAPAETIGKIARMRYERGEFVKRAYANDVTRVLQLNGMIIPTMKIPTLSHNQDPWPYRPQAYLHWKEHVVAFFKRRAQRQALKNAACLGFTSNYLRDLLIRYHGIQPKCAEVFYNGLAESWLERARQPLPDWSSRPMEIVTVSNVHPYKRNHLVIQALPILLKRPGLSDLVYRIVGHCEPVFREQLESLAKSLGVEKHVIVHGRLDDARMQQYYRQAKAFAMMSVCESFGIPAIEAMTFGTPVVTSDCCAMPEVCGDAAILTPVDDVEALARNLEIALTDAARVEQMRKKGADRVQKFRWGDSAEAMAQALERMQ
jgi:glycosyltransferase involved in cell wall biosynthesis